MNLRILLPFLFLLGFQLTFAQADKNQQKEIEDLMTQLHNNGQFNGTILVAEKGKVIYKAGHGYADYSAKRKLATSSPFYLASVSKQFTTMGIMMLKEKGKLSYDDVVTKYFPDFPAYAKSVTIRQMMHHTSGIANHYSLGIYRAGLNNDDVYQTLLKQKALDFEPETKYTYSNGAYVMLAMIIEKVSGQSLPEFMKENIFTPLGMDKTLVFDKATPEIKDRAIGYNPAWALEDYEIFTTGAGGLYSTVEDLLKWDQALYTDKLVSAAALEEAYTAATLKDGNSTGYGFGWRVMKKESGGKVVNHSGGLNGFRTFLERDLEHQRTIILLTNNTNAYLPSILRELRNIQNGDSYELPKIIAGRKLQTMIGEMGLEKALAQYEMLKANEADKHDFNENDLNDLGYYFLVGQKDLNTAIAIFEQNVKDHPEAFNTYDSLAEAYLEKAKANYKKSLELNPDNDNARKMLKEMGVEVKEETKTMELPDEVLATYVGKYQLNPSFAINITKDGSQLSAQATNQGANKIFPQSKHKFYLKTVAAQVEFNKNDAGKVESLTLFQNGQEMLFKRME